MISPASTVPGANPFTWSFSLGITQGVHYYFARAEQADGAWLLPVAGDALQVLLELGELGGRVSLVWPRGASI